MRAIRNYVCEQCGHPFQSRGKDKRFCSLSCYANSPVGRERLQRAAELGGLARRGGKGYPQMPCAVCGKKMEIHANHEPERFFCSLACRRGYWRELFDSLIGNPEGLPLPNNYDEFLDRNELPCLMPGCDWSGPSLSGHLFQCHGIKATQFKEAAGFNRSTGLVGKAMSAKLAAPHVGVPIDLRLLSAAGSNPDANYHPELRLEGREHMRKARLGKKKSEETRAKIAKANLETKRAAALLRTMARLEAVAEKIENCHE